MAFLQWRRFNFFEKDVAKDPDTNQPFEKLKDFNITCVTSGRGIVVFGDDTGHLHLMSRQLKLSSFPAFEHRVTHVQQLQENPVLVVVGEDESDAIPLVKLWNVEKTDPLGKPHCIRIMRSLNVFSQVTALSVHENLNLLAIGFHDGSILLVRGDITRERQNKPKILSITEKSPITGLKFRAMGKTSLLFAVTSDEVYSVILISKDKETILRLDTHGCPPKCSILGDAKQDYQFVIGRQDAVYFYHQDGRGPCFAFEGEKIILHWFKSYLVIVGRDSKPILQATAMGIPSVEMNVVTIYDIPNKFIAYSAPFPVVIDIVSEWGMLYVLCRDGKVFNLLEKDTQSKLDMLFRKNQYSLAITLAKSQQYDEDGLIEIFRQYGDHLYSKGDHDGAIAQYKKTIGKLEASYVIRKFLDAQRIHNLTDYLQSLHKNGLASEDHTTLLLNCYTKLKDICKLDEFIMTKDREVDFDVEIAMKVCRQAGYYKHALSVAEKHKQHDWYLKIQIEDLKQYVKALDYISKLEFFEAEKNMKKYGKILMCEVPDHATAMLKLLCTGNMSSEIDPLTASPEDFIHIFDNNSERLMEFLEHMRKVKPSSSNLVYNTLLELYLQSYNHADDESAKKTIKQKILELLKLSETGYNIDQALVLCEINNFKPGVLHLYEKAKLYQQILFYHMENNDYDNIIQTCSRYGSNDPNLWVQALWFFCKLDQNQKLYIVEVLKEIEVNNLLSPILVVEIMSKSHTASLDLIKDYICRYLQKEKEQTSEDERLIKQYKEETEKMRAQIEELKTSAKIFQVSKCSGCNHQLELPSVHFLCNHSYHQQCFESYSAENDSECPLCLPENRKVMNIIEAQETQRDLHEQFHHQLERSEDGFSIVADYFGRGVFNKVTLVVDSAKPTNVSNLP